MISYPLYPSEEKTIFTLVILGGGVFLIVVAFVITYFQSPREERSFSLSPVLAQKLVGFLFFFLGLYSFFSVFNFKTVAIDKENRSLSVQQTLFGKVVQEKTYKINETMKVVVVPGHLESIFDINVERGGAPIHLAKGSKEFADDLAFKLTRDLGLK
jgi:hypothetical protein